MAGFTGACAKSANQNMTAGPVAFGAGAVLKGPAKQGARRGKRRGRRQWADRLNRWLRHPEGRVEAAAVVDHIRPHEGNEVLFWDAGNLQSLCKRHHEGAKRFMGHSRQF
jgi:hypothetical protein